MNRLFTAHEPAPRQRRALGSCSGTLRTPTFVDPFVAHHMPSVLLQPDTAQIASSFGVGEADRSPALPFDRTGRSDFLKRRPPETLRHRIERLFRPEQQVSPVIAVLRLAVFQPRPEASDSSSVDVRMDQGPVDWVRGNRRR